MQPRWNESPQAARALKSCDAHLTWKAERAKSNFPPVACDRWHVQRAQRASPGGPSCLQTAVEDGEPATTHHYFVMMRTVGVAVLLLSLQSALRVVNASGVSGAPVSGGGAGPAGRERRRAHAHDFGSGDLGDESWRSVDADRDKLDTVTFVPGDYATLHEAIEGVQQRQSGSITAQRTVISLRAGSHLMPRRWREVAVPGKTWPYYQSHAPRYLNGEKTLALIPDDGCEPKTSEDYPCQWLPERDTRFLNITGPIQVMGSEEMTSRVCGAWRFHAPPSVAGWLRELVCLNQEEGVVFVHSGSWKFDGCVFAACGRGELATDIMILRGRATVVASQCTFECLRPDPAGPEWARWPPGLPSNAVGVFPIVVSPLPQNAYAGVGVDAGMRTRVMLDRCLLQGLVAGVLARDATDLSVDDSVFRWNQFGLVLNDAPHAVVRSCTFRDNVYAAFYLEDESSVEGCIFSVMASDIVGEVWGSEWRPARLDQRDLTHQQSAPEFIGPGAPGHHRFQRLDEEDDWMPGKGTWSFPDWEAGNCTDGYNPYKDVGGSGSTDGVGALLKDLTIRRRNAPAAFQAEAGATAGT